MHIADLQPCRYHRGHLDANSWEAPLLAIGWLEHPHAFPVGATVGAFAARLASLVSQTRTVFPQYTFRGVADCTFCQASGMPSPGPLWSQENIIVPGEGEVYASPGGIVHYVEAHRYCPPSRFVSAVLQCPPCDSPEYREALRHANGGIEAPMETHSEYSTRLKRDLEAAAQVGRKKSGE